MWKKVVAKRSEKVSTIRILSSTFCADKNLININQHSGGISGQYPTDSNAEMASILY